MRVALIPIKDVILYFVRDILNILAQCYRPKLPTLCERQVSYLY